MKILKEHRKNLIACVLGDGYLSSDGRFSCFHNIKQEELVKFKMEKLKPFLTQQEVVYRVTNNTQQCGFRLKTSEYTKFIRTVLYSNNRKTITRKTLDKLDASHLAIWWMDDGSCSARRNKVTNNISALIFTLSTCISKEENQIIIDWIKEKFDIQMGQRKMRNQYAIICGTKEGKKLANLLKPFILPSMLYKIEK